MLQLSLGPGRVPLLPCLRDGTDNDLMVVKMKHIGALPFKAKLDVDAFQLWMLSSNCLKLFLVNKHYINKNQKMFV